MFVMSSTPTESGKSLLPLKKILVATDGSENAKRAIQTATDLARKDNAELVLIHVVAQFVPIYSPVGASSWAVDYSTYYDDLEKEGKKLINQTVEEAKSQGVNAKGEVLRAVASTVATIVEEASKENCDLIVVGTRGLGGFKKLLLGSVSSGVVAHAHCAVLVVR